MKAAESFQGYHRLQDIGNHKYDSKRSNLTFWLLLQITYPASFLHRYVFLDNVKLELAQICFSQCAFTEIAQCKQFIIP